MEGTRALQKWVVFPFLVMYLCCLQLLAAEHVPVKFLPGFQGPLPFDLETGYIGVGEEEAVQLFYYFVKSQRNPKEDPLLIWLTGGPGCSSLSAFLFEIGPLTIKEQRYEGGLPTLALSPHSWTKVSSIVFVDSPVGTGFSYATKPSAFHSSDKQQGLLLYQFIVKWLMEHPEFFSNSVFIGGDSYSGITIPYLVKVISDANEDGIEPLINFKGYLLGNAFTDRVIEQNSKIPFSHGMALISDELYESLQRNCKGRYYNAEPSNTNCSRDMKYFEELVSIFFMGTNILEAQCPVISPRPFQLFENKRRSAIESSKILMGLDPPLPPYKCRTYLYVLSYYWLDDRNVRKALQVKEGTVKNWVRCNFSLPYTRDIEASTKYHLYLSTKGYRSLIYSGDHDIGVPFLGTQEWIRSLNYSIVDDWRQWLVNDQVAGYTRTYSNRMTFATVKGGGHTAPEYKPVECFTMFKKWISGQPL